MPCDSHLSGLCVLLDVDHEDGGVGADDDDDDVDIGVVRASVGGCAGAGGHRQENSGGS